MLFSPLDKDFWSVIFGIPEKNALHLEGKRPYHPTPSKAKVVLLSILTLIAAHASADAPRVDPAILDTDIIVRSSYAVAMDCEIAIRISIMQRNAEAASRANHACAKMIADMEQRLIPTVTTYDAGNFAATPANIRAARKIDGLLHKVIEIQDFVRAYLRHKKSKHVD